MRQRLVFFDLMDTLLEFTEEESQYIGAMADAVQSLGIASAGRFVSDYERWRSERPNAYPEHMEVDLPNRIRAVVNGVADAAVEEIVESYRQFYLSRTRLLPGVRAMLEGWRGHATLGVVSNFFLAGFPEALCRHHRIDHHFELIIDSAQVGWRKPHEVIYQTALDRVGISKAHQCHSVFVGDNLVADVEGAARTGFVAVHYCPEGNSSAGVHICDWGQFLPNGPIFEESL